jgi:hypothetical protein
VGDGWAAGITWNRGESVRFGLIERLNGSRVDYVRCEDDLGVRYTYRSHSSALALVQVGSFRLGGARRENCMVLIVDGQERTGFRYARAVRTELDWLNESGIVHMSALERDAAENCLAEYGCGQYWTAYHKVLPYSGIILEELARVGGRDKTPGGTECGNPPDLCMSASRRQR